MLTTYIERNLFFRSYKYTIDLCPNALYLNIFEKNLKTTRIEIGMFFARNSIKLWCSLLCFQLQNPLTAFIFWFKTGKFVLPNVYGVDTSTKPESEASALDINAEQMQKKLAEETQKVVMSAKSFGSKYDG